MTSTGISAFDLDIKKYYMTKNGWQYYVTELPDEDGIGEALVEGFEQEVGTFSIDEIKPYILLTAEGEDLKNLLPAQGFVWNE
tara:strand:- start:22883 stop:23131 length:249 start_codon:yes stop_codon:yes gene_type:complete